MQELKNEAASSKRRPIDKDKLAKVNKEISQYKRQISELRSNTQKELDALKSKVFPRSILVVVYFKKSEFFLDDISKASSGLVRACKGVEAKSAFIEDSGGGLVHIGTPQEMFAKLKRSQDAIEALQAQSDNLRTEKNSLNRDILNLQKTLAEQEETIHNLRRENERHVSKVSAYDK